MIMIRAANPKGIMSFRTEGEFPSVHGGKRLFKGGLGEMGAKSKGRLGLGWVLGLCGAGALRH